MALWMIRFMMKANCYSNARWVTKLTRWWKCHKKEKTVKITQMRNIHSFCTHGSLSSRFLITRIRSTGSTWNSIATQSITLYLNWMRFRICYQPKILVDKKILRKSSLVPSLRPIFPPIRVNRKFHLHLAKLSEMTTKMKMRWSHQSKDDKNCLHQKVTILTWYQMNQCLCARAQRSKRLRRLQKFLNLSRIQDLQLLRLGLAGLANDLQMWSKQQMRRDNPSQYTRHTRGKNCTKKTKATAKTTKKEASSTMIPTTRPRVGRSHSTNLLVPSRRRTRATTLHQVRRLLTMSKLDTELLQAKETSAWACSMGPLLIRPIARTK